MVFGGVLPCPFPVRRLARLLNCPAAKQAPAFDGCVFELEGVLSCRVGSYSREPPLEPEEDEWSSEYAIERRRCLRS